MSRTVRIEVTAEDIEQGERGECDRDPVALAIARALPDSRPEVGEELISLYVAGRVVCLDAPASVRAFVRVFDERGPVVPFSFELDVPMTPDEARQLAHALMHAAECEDDEVTS